MDKDEKLGQAIDRVESLMYALKLPIPPIMHIESFRELLPEIVEQLKEGYIESTGDNPWE